MIIPQTYYPQSNWTVGAVRSALDRHELGDLYDSARLVDWMGRDPRIHGDLGTRVRALAARSGLPFTVEPSNEADQRRAAAVAKQVSALWWNVLPEEVIAQLLADAIMLGVCVAMLEWDGPQRDRLHVMPLPAHNLCWDEWAGHWYYQTRDGREVVTPGDGRWFLHLPHGQRSWMRGAVRPLGHLSVARYLSQRDWDRHCEKHGMPVLAVREPAFAQDDVSNGVAAFYDQFRNLGSETVLRLPQGSGAPGDGWEAKWLETTAQGWQSFQGRLARLDSDVSVVLLGRDAASADKALGGDGEAERGRVRIEYLASDAEPLTTSLRDQVWMPWGRVTQANWDDSLAPWGRWNTRPPADLSRRAATLSVLGDAIGKLTGQGVDPKPLIEEFQLTQIAGAKPQDPTPLYKYHFDFGIISRNEARERLGLPPVAGGDEPPKPIVADQSEPEGEDVDVSEFDEDAAA
jgi:hypothetical protein